MIADYPRAVTELESDKISPIQLTISRIFWPEIVLRMKDNESCAIACSYLEWVIYRARKCISIIDELKETG